MKTAIVTVLLAFLVAATSQQKLNYLDAQDSSVSIEQIIDKFAELQSDIYKNVFTHFMEKTVKEWRAAGKIEREIREEVLKLVTDVNGSLFDKLTEFMQKRLFEKLGTSEST
jgi:hypothetical protein